MADSNIIHCPQCKVPIQLNEALAEHLRADVRREFEAKAQQMAADARKAAETAKALELKDLQEQIREKERRLVESQQKELEIRKQQRLLEERQRAMDLEVARKLDEERRRIADEVARRTQQEHHAKDLEKDKLISDLRRQAEEFKRMAEQGSQQAQGEVIELELENLLRMKFPHDQIEPVGKGVRGADVVQRVRHQNGRSCGTIIWESKQTKAWSPGWIEKLKEDQRAVKAEVAVLVTAVLPKDVAAFDIVDGVFVASHACAMSLALLLRGHLIQVTLAKVAAGGTLEKKEAVYNYLTGTEFRQRIETIIETSRSMRDQLNREKIAWEKVWSMREKQIDQVTKQMAGMYGDLSGLGASLPPVRSLQIESVASPELPEPEPPQDTPRKPPAGRASAADEKLLF